MAQIARRRLGQLAAAVAVITFAIVLAAPAVAWMRFNANPAQERLYYAQLARQVTDQWHRATGRPLPIVAGGGEGLTSALSFYSSDWPDAAHFYSFGAEPWITQERLERDGWVLVCENNDLLCLSDVTDIQQTRPAARRIPITGTAGYLHRTAQAGFTMLLVPPAPTAPAVHKP
jgi:hypothetical protein